jgi:hypothetical protein
LGASLTFPNDACYTTGGDNVTITNGAIAGHVDVNGSDAIPSDVGGTHWALCGGSGGPACTGAPGGGIGCVGCVLGSNLPAPGVDQFAEAGQTLGGGLPGPVLTNAAQADTLFSVPFGIADGSAGAGQSATETLGLMGPSSSSDQSSAFTTAWTWTAVP